MMDFYHIVLLAAVLLAAALVLKLASDLARVINELDDTETANLPLAAKHKDFRRH